MTPTPKVSIGLLAAVLSLGALAQAAGQFHQPRPPEDAVAHRERACVSSGHEWQKLDFYTVKGAGQGGFKDPKVPELTREFLATHLKPTKPSPWETRWLTESPSHKAKP